MYLLRDPIAEVNVETSCKISAGLCGGTQHRFGCVCNDEEGL